MYTYIDVCVCVCVYECAPNWRRTELTLMPIISAWSCMSRPVALFNGCQNSEGKKTLVILCARKNGSKKKGLLEVYIYAVIFLIHNIYGVAQHFL